MARARYASPGMAALRVQKKKKKQAGSSGQLRLPRDRLSVLSFSILNLAD